MKPIILYYSSTGFTKKYVDWLSQKLNADVYELNTAQSENLDENRPLIIASSLHAGNLRHFKKFKDLIQDKKFPQMFVLGIGAAPDNLVVSDNIKNNHHQDLQEDAKYYYLPGGLNYDKMTFFDRWMMKLFAFMMKRKAKKGEFDQVWAEKLSTSYDLTDQVYLDELLTHF